jgi:RNA polymerase sigma factor (sigma-70 family)
METKVIGIWHGSDGAVVKEIATDADERTVDRSIKAPVFDDGYLMRLRAGDDETARHFNSYFRRLLRLKLWGKFTREREEELVDSVMAAAIDKVMQGQPRKSAHLPAYVAGICSNLTNRSLRRGLNVVGVDLDQMQVPDRANSAEANILLRERAQSVRSVLANLGQRDRGVLLDLFYHDAERDEVCRKYQVTRKTLRLILFRARQRFQAQWQA